jgi:hypothetical protein
MRRRVLLQRIAEAAKERGLLLEDVREGSNHTIYRVAATPFSVPRHTDINEITAQSIMKHLERELGQGWWR